MADVTPLFTFDDLSDRVGPAKLRQCLDDENDGDVAEDDSAVIRLILDASAMAWAWLPRGTVFETDEIPTYIKKLALDCAQGTMALRHPEVMGAIDGPEMLKMARKDLQMYGENFTQVEEVTREDTFCTVVGRNDSGSAWVR